MLFQLYAVKISAYQAYPVRVSHINNNIADVLRQEIQVINTAISIQDKFAFRYLHHVFKTNNFA